MDTPTFGPPLNPAEQPIFDSLLHLRDELQLLKAERCSYCKPEDVIRIYEQVIEQVHRLNDTRASEHKELEQNRVDRVLDCCFQLISLFYMRLGRNQEAPAGYAFVSNMKRLLDHLKEVGFYSNKDLSGLEVQVETIQHSLEKGKDSYSPHLITLLRNKLNACHVLLGELQQSIACIQPDLFPIYEKLISILRQLSAANTRTQFPEKQVKHFKQQLLDIKAILTEKGILGDDGHIQKGQERVVEVLTKALDWSDMVLEKKGKIDPRFEETYDRLRHTRNQLEKLSITQNYSLRETDLYNFQRELDKVDSERVDGNFLDAKGVPAELHAQRTLLYLLRRSYAYIYSLIVSSQAVSEALMPVHNQLQTLRTCLLEVERSGGVSNSRELYPYTMKLSSIDNMRVDGKFKVGDYIPEGQGVVSALMLQCYDIIGRLKVSSTGIAADLPAEVTA